ncbi:MAG TPA: 5'-nucleotidase C-terminal domain-containing protein [Candidatus Nanopelagicales bacterium]|nr:5'-nucleotidase C-terminal domain-containing protein [Candidatus Nanopelagicales bacterium]
MALSSRSLIRVFAIAGVAGLATSLLTIAPGNAASSDVTLTLLHNNDGESKLLPQEESVGDVTYEAGSIAAFKAVADREKRRARGNKDNSVLMVYAGDSFLASRVLICSDPSNPDSDATVWDAAAQKRVGYDAHVLGNHEFDYGTGFLRRYIDAFGTNGKVTQPFLSANLDYSEDPNLKGMVARGGIIDGTPTKNDVLGQAMIYEDPRTGEEFGIVAAITPTLQSISSPLPTEVTTANIQAVARVVQRQINKLEKQGVNKIILVSHLQSSDFDKELVGLLEGVDVAVAGGGDEALANPKVPEYVQLLPGSDEAEGEYPILTKDSAGNEVPIVTTAGNYTYLGRIDLTFSKDGELKSWNEKTSFPRRVVIADDVSASLGVTDAVTPNATLRRTVEKRLEDGCLAEQDQPFAASQTVFNTARGNAESPGVRTQETNGGNLVADAFMNAYNTRRADAGLQPASASNPVVAMTNGGGIRINNLPADGTPGAISRGMTFDLLPFDNRMTVIPDLTASQLKEIFERSCSVSERGGGQFMQISGLQVTCSRSGQAQEVGNPVGDNSAGAVTTPGTRVQSIVLSDGTALVQGGAPVAGAPSVDVVTNSFTAAGGDNYGTFESAGGKTTLGVSYEQALYDYLLTFPAVEGLPTIPNSDARYAPGVNQRFFWVS